MMNNARKDSSTAVNRKSYCKPQVRVVKIKSRSSLLQSSGEPPVMDHGGFGFRSTGEDRFNA